MTQPCSLVIQYAAGTVGSFQDILKVTYNNSSYAAEADFALTGQTVPLVIPATLSITDGGTDSYGQVLTTQTYNKTFTVLKGGTQPATGVSAEAFSTSAFSFEGGAYPGTGGSCGNTITATCTIVVALTPTVPGNLSDAIKLDFNNGSTNTSVSQTITAIADNPALLSMVPNTPYDFETTPLNYPVSTTFTLSNPASSTSAMTLVISGLSAPFTNQGGCGATLAPGASCTFGVGFDPTVGGPASTTMQISYFDGVSTNQSLSVGLTGTGGLGAFLVPSVSSINFGNVIVGESSTVPVTLKYYGGLAAQNLTFSGLGIPFGFGGGAYPGGGSCSNSISAACTIELEFSPVAIGQATTPFVISYEDGTGTMQSTTINLIGTGIAPAPAVLSFNPSSYDFGSVLVGKTVTTTITIQRTGNLTATGLALSGFAGDFTQTGGNCGASLAPGASCHITVAFSPSAAGSRGPDVVTLGYFDGTANQQTTLTLNGTGIQEAIVTTLAQNFGSVPIQQTVSGNVTFTNTGNIDADSFTLVPGTPAAPFAFVSTTCGATLSAGSSCTATVSFSPVAAISSTGSVQASFTSGGVAGSASAKVTGTGTISISITAAPAAFGTIPILTTATLSINISNSGTRTAAAFTLNSSSLSAPFSLVSTTCGATLPGGTSCTAMVAFAPLTPGNFSGTLTGSYNSGVGNLSFSAALSGTGAIAVAVTAAGADFSTENIGKTENVTVNVSNTGTAAATGLQIVTGSFTAPFSFISTTCGNVLAAGASCSVTLAFAPTAPGNYAIDWTGNYNNQIATVSFSGAASGAGSVSPLLAVNGNHTCFSTALGTLECWGENNYGQLGLGDFIDRGTAPGPSTGMGADLPAVSLGTNRYPTFIALGYWHSCAILDNGSVKCWGANTFGQLGLGSSATEVGGSPGDMGDNLPSVNLGNFQAVALSLGYSHSCALSNQGTVKCWGKNSEGQLGMGDTVNRGSSSNDMGDNLPAIDLGGHGALEISAGTSHTCALLDDHSIRCWGNNFYGQLGLGDIQNRGDVPEEMGAQLPGIQLGNGLTAQSVVSGGAYTCALLSSGAVKCWGKK